MSSKRNPFCIQTWKGRGKQPYRFRLVASNGRILSTSGEGYASKRNRDNAVSIIEDSYNEGKYAGKFIDVRGM